MYRKTNTIKKSSHARQRGSSLVIAIFIIIVLSLLGAALVRMLNSSAESIVYEVYGTRAFHAAQSGLQMKLAERFPLIGSADAPNCNSISPKFTNVAGLNACEAVVTCTPDTDASITTYTIKSLGSCDIGGVVTSRTVEVVARDL